MSVVDTLLRSLLPRFRRPARVPRPAAPTLTPSPLTMPETPKIRLFIERTHLLRAAHWPDGGTTPAGMYVPPNCYVVQHWNPYTHRLDAEKVVEAARFEQLFEELPATGSGAA